MLGACSSHSEAHAHPRPTQYMALPIALALPFLYSTSTAINGFTNTPAITNKSIFFCFRDTKRTDHFTILNLCLKLRFLYLFLDFVPQMMEHISYDDEQLSSLMAPNTLYVTSLRNPLDRLKSNLYYRYVCQFVCL